MVITIICSAGHSEEARSLGTRAGAAWDVAVQLPATGEGFDDGDAVDAWRLIVDPLFGSIDLGDTLYVLAHGGAVDTVVASAIGYAHARDVRIESSEPLRDGALACLVAAVVSPEELVARGRMAAP